MDTARYRAFLAAADAGSLTRAAAALQYTPSGISQLIKALEKDLDVTLLSRSRTGVCLTAEGKLLLSSIRELLRQEEAIAQRAAEIRGLTIGTITIASYHCLAMTWMPELISGFQERYPNIRINLIEGTEQKIRTLLEEHIADLAFFSCTNPHRFDWIPLMEDRMLAVLPKSHPLASAKTFPIEAYRSERFIMPEEGQDFDVLHILDAFQIVPNISLSTVDSYTAIAMVEKGLGVSLMNEISIQNRRGAVAVLPTEPSYRIQMGIAVPSLQAASPAIRKFAAYAVNRLAVSSARAEGEAILRLHMM